MKIITIVLLMLAIGIVGATADDLTQTKNEAFQLVSSATLDQLNMVNTNIVFATNGVFFVGKKLSDSSTNNFSTTRHMDTSIKHIFASKMNPIAKARMFYRQRIIDATNAAQISTITAPLIKAGVTP